MPQEHQIYFSWVIFDGNSALYLNGSVEVREICMHQYQSFRVIHTFCFSSVFFFMKLLFIFTLAFHRQIDKKYRDGKFDEPFAFDEHDEHASHSFVLFEVKFCLLYI